MQKQSIVIEPHETIKEFRLYLYERENAKATIDKYLTDSCMLEYKKNEENLFFYNINDTT